MKIHEFLDNEEKWTQGALARHGQLGTFRLSVDSPDATCWCALGLIFKFYPDHSHRVIKKVARAIENISAVKPPEDFDSNAIITLWNDHKDRKYEEVRGIFEELDL